MPVSEWDFDKQTPISTNQSIQFQILEHIERYRKRIKRLEALEIDATLDNIIDDSHTINCTVSDYFNRVIKRLEETDKFFNPLIIAYLKKFLDGCPNKKSLSTTC